jgi:hypothetical protein
MSNAFLISAYNLKELSLIHGNVEDSILTPTIRIVQDTTIEPIIGTSLYTRLLEGIDANDLNADEVLLMDSYIIPVLAMGCNLETVLTTTYQLRNKATGITNDEWLKGASETEINRIQDNFRSKLEHYRQKLINYLKFNSGKYPEYNDYFSSPDAFFDCLTFGTEGIAPDRGQPKVNISFR